MAQFFPGLRSRNDSARLRAARDLQKYVSTELRELPDERSSEILDEVNQHIFSLISSQEVHEKKGGILAIGELQGSRDGSRDHVCPLSESGWSGGRWECGKAGSLCQLSSQHPAPS